MNCLPFFASILDLDPEKSLQSQQQQTEEKGVNDAEPMLKDGPIYIKVWVVLGPEFDALLTPPAGTLMHAFFSFHHTLLCF